MNTAGPCVIRVPDWVPDHEKTHPDAKYYLYFSGHHGKQIQLAWSDSITGRWRLFNAGDNPDRAWGKAGEYSGAKTPGGEKPSHKGRHFAFYHNPERDRDTVNALYTTPRRLPESIVAVVFDLSGLSEADRLNPQKWKRVYDVEQVLLKPEKYCEGIDRAYKRSHNGTGHGYQLRDPYVFADDDGKLYLFYSGRGENALGVAELKIESETKEKSLRVTAPSRALPVLVGENRLIGWWSTGGIDKVDIEITDDGKSWHSLVKGIDNVRYYLWTVPDKPTSQAQLRIRETGGEVLATSEPFIIAKDKTLTLISPTRQTVYTAGQVHHPAFATTGDIAAVDFAYSVDDGGWVTFAQGHSNRSTKRAEWNAPAHAWTVPNIASDHVRLRVTESGGGASYTSEPFSVVPIER
jgi:hypothetical protein